MDRDDELFSSILSLCEDEGAPAVDVEVSETVSTSNEGGSTSLAFSKDTSISLSPIRYASPQKMADTFNNNNPSFTDKFTPKAKSGLDVFKSMLLHQRNTSTPLMDRWSLTKSARSRDGKRRHDVDAISSNLETIAEQEFSSDEEQTVRRDEDAEKTYDDLLQDLSILCEKELTERCETVNAEPPENKIKAEHQISRINLNSILEKTSVVAGVVRDKIGTEEGTNAFQSEPGRFIGVNTTTQSSVMALEESDSFEDADDILGLDEFLESDEDNDYDSLLEETTFQGDDVTVVPVSAVLSSSLHNCSSVHKTDSTQKIPTYKCINSSDPINTGNTNSFLASSSASVAPTSEHMTVSVAPTSKHMTLSISNDSVAISSTHMTNLTNTTCTDTSISVISSACTKQILQSALSSPTTSENVLCSSSVDIGTTDSKFLLAIPSSKNSPVNSTVTAFEKNSQPKSILLYENISMATCSSEKTLTTSNAEFPEKRREESQIEEEEDVSGADRVSQEDEFTLDLTKDSDELDEFLHMEGFKVIDDLKECDTVDKEKRKTMMKNLVKKDQVSLTSKCPTDTATETEYQIDKKSDGDVLASHSMPGLSPRAAKQTKTAEIPVVKDSSKTTSDVSDSLAGQKVRSTTSGESLTQQNVVDKVVAWQARCISSEQHQNDKKAGSDDSQSQSAVSSHQTVPHTVNQQDRKALPQVQVHPFNTQLEPEPHPAVSDKSEKISPGKNCKINDVKTAGVSSPSGKVKTESTVKSPRASQGVKDNNNVVDKNQNIVTPSFYHDYEAERRFIQGENSLMKQVMQKWGSEGIQTPDTNLSFSNRMRKNNPHYHSRLEGQKISTMWTGSNSKHQHYKEAKRFRSDVHSQLNNINNLKQQLQDINRAVRDEIDKSIYGFEERQNTLDHVFVQRKQALNVQQQLELCQARRHINPHMLQCQLLQLRCEHQHQRDQLAYIFNSEMNQLKNNHQDHVHAIRSRFEQRAQQLISFIEQLTTVESTQTDPQFGPHVVTHLVKGPCRSNNNVSSTVTVCLPADIATAIIKEDEVYDMFYVHTKK